jgi:hypothetical protein
MPQNRVLEEDNLCSEHNGTPEFTRYPQFCHPIGTSLDDLWAIVAPPQHMAFLGSGFRPSSGWDQLQPRHPVLRLRAVGGSDWGSSDT